MKQKVETFIMLGELEVGKTLVSQYMVHCAQLRPLLHKFGQNLLTPQTKKHEGRTLHKLLYKDLTHEGF
jgi:hypothetical protein